MFGIPGGKKCQDGSEENGEGFEWDARKCMNKLDKRVKCMRLNEWMMVLLGTMLRRIYRSCHYQCLPREKSRTTCTIKIAFQRVRRNLCPTSLLSPANTAAIQEERRDFCLILPIYVAMEY
ncbi:hypothetical protein E2C01_074304 [Portunus trituberculatus]|uniref:Uncharacterized protein n=1 Tax=Portunus trituberculatus TaxID=210409 RepID=A0A5B7I5C3_PORTR|nr:hypothetical protein [Portunus trituberculatus]